MWSPLTAAASCAWNWAPRPASRGSGPSVESPVGVVVGAGDAEGAGVVTGAGEPDDPGEVDGAGEVGR